MWISEQVKEQKADREVLSLKRSVGLRKKLNNEGKASQDLSGDK